MAKWEYCSIDMFNEVITFSKTDRRDESKIRQDKAGGDRDAYDTMHRMIAALGLEEWELVGVSSIHPGFPMLFFKRPLE